MTKEKILEKIRYILRTVSHRCDEEGFSVEHFMKTSAVDLERLMGAVGNLSFDDMKWLMEEYENTLDDIPNHKEVIDKYFSIDAQGGLKW